MGICTSDPLGYLIKEYGEDVCKYFVAIKSEEFLDQTSPKLTERVQEQFKTTAGTLDKEFDTRESGIKSNFDSTLNELKQNNSKALDTAKSTNGKTEEQLFGFNSIQSQFTKLKAAKDGKLKQQETNILKVIQQKKDELKKQIQNSKPSLPLFDNMPLCVRQKVLSEGEEKFAPQIKQKQEEILGIFDRVANLGNLDQTIKNAVGLGEADKLLKDSSSTFQRAKNAIAAFKDPAKAIQSRSCFG